MFRELFLTTVVVISSVLSQEMVSPQFEQRLPIAESEEPSQVSEMTTEQRNSHKHKHKGETIVILKPTPPLPPIICRPHEVISDCVTPCQPTCEFPHQTPCPEFVLRSHHKHHDQKIIIIPGVNKPPHHKGCHRGCVCAPGFVRSEFGQCIPLSHCPPLCKPHSHFEKCGPRCQPTCELAEPRSLSICSHDKHICVSGCFCDAGYVKDLRTGQCVKPDHCIQICPENEHYSDVGTQCVPSCQHPHIDPYKCHNYTRPLPGCYCDSGFIRDWTTKKCVRECPHYTPPHHYPPPSHNYPPPPSHAYPPTPSHSYPPKAPPSYPPKEHNYPPKEPNYPPKEPSYPSKEHNYSPKEPSYPSKEPSYPPKEHNYSPKEPSYPSKEPSYPPKEHNYSPKEPSYPSKAPSYPPTSYEKCPENEEHYECKPCTPTCLDPHKKCSYECHSGCDCKKGFVRNESHKCIKLCECPQFEPHYH